PASPKSNNSSGKRRNRKACFVCKSVDHLIKDCNYHTKKMPQPTPRNYAHRGHPMQYAPPTHSKPQKHRVPTAVLTKSKPVSHTAIRPVSAALPNNKVTRPRNAHPVVTKPQWLVLFKGNSQQALKDKGVIDNGCSRHMTGNMSYFSDFEELNGGYVAFGGNPKGGKITGKGKIKTGTGPSWLFDIDSITRTMNYQPVYAGNQTNSGAGYRDLNAEFEDCSENSKNEVNAASSTIPTVG
nr:ribonuclease H-like domain-containing protein [Tanacetum cinerariifolium]